MPSFRLVSDFEATGDQPQAVDRLVEGLRRGHKGQALEVLVGISLAARVPQRCAQGLAVRPECLVSP